MSAPREEDVEERLEENRQWIKDWREGMFDSGSRDAQGWPIEMHGLVEDLEWFMAEVARLSGERDAYAKRMPEVIETHNHWKSRAVAAEAEVVRLSGERDNWQQVARETADNLHETIRRREARAEGERERLREALEDLLAIPTNLDEARRKARALLSAGAEQ